VLNNFLLNYRVFGALSAKPKWSRVWTFGRVSTVVLRNTASGNLNAVMWSNNMSVTFFTEHPSPSQVKTDVTKVLYYRMWTLANYLLWDKGIHIDISVLKRPGTAISMQYIAQHQESYFFSSGSPLLITKTNWWANKLLSISLPHRLHECRAGAVAISGGDGCSPDSRLPLTRPVNS
jgi:hypothetical protein